MMTRDFLSTATTSPEAISEICRDAAAFVEELDGPPDLAVLFVTSHHGASYAEVARRVVETTGVRHLIGCSAESVVGER